MPGAVTQLHKTGEQDRWLTRAPDHYLFKTAYKQHGRFAYQTFVEHINLTRFGETSVCPIALDADLITNITLHVELPTLNPGSLVRSSVCNKDTNVTCFCSKCTKTGPGPVFGWANSIGHLMIQDYGFYAGSKCINRKTGEWLEWLSEHNQTAEKKAAYWEMIGKRDPPTFKPTSLSGPQDLLIPLDFFFTGKSTHAFPICNVDEIITVQIKWNKFENCWVSSESGISPSFVPEIKASLLVECVYLTELEKNKILGNQQLYLIEQLQKTGPCHFPKETSRPVIELDMLQPVTSVHWAARRSDIKTRSSGRDPDFSYGNDWFNYSCYKSRKNIIRDPFKTCQLRLDGEEREPELPSKFYRLLQNYYRQKKTPSNYIYSYYFSAFPGDTNPSGECNMSMYNNKKLICNMDNEYPEDYEIVAYAISYNFLIIKNKKITLVSTV